MTREECIALLERYGNYEGMGIPNLAGCKEAMLMAAKLLKPQSPINPYFYCQFGGTRELCSDCKRNHINSGLKTQDIGTWFCPSTLGTKKCSDYIKQQPQLPSDVEEATEKYTEGYYDDSSAAKRAAYHAFRAGAEWAMEQFELVYEGNGVIPDERGGYWPTEVKLYRKKD